MDLAEKTRLLKKLFPQIVPHEVIDTPKEGLESMGFAESVLETASHGIERLRKGQVLEATHANTLEAIIHKQFRPAVNIINNTYDRPPAPWEDLDGEESRRKIETAIRSIGRIELPGFALAPYGGTGFVVGKNLLMTNRHVAEIFARGLGDRNILFKPNRRSAINFRREILPSPEVLDLTVKRVVMIHPYWDMALLEVEGLSDTQGRLPLSVQDPATMIGHNIVVIGYPAQDDRNDLMLQNQIFGGVFGVKRLLPGVLRERRNIESFENTVNAVTHDASTLGGNSGSAVVDVASGQVLALHFAGLYLDANFAVPTYELARDSRVVDAGVIFDQQIPSTNKWSDRWQVADNLQEAVNRKTSSGFTGNQNIQATVQVNSVTWTIPLRVTVSIGNASSAAGRSEGIPQIAVATEGLFSRDDGTEFVNKAYAATEPEKFEDSGFKWEAALAACSASHLAYQNAGRVSEVCKRQWGFQSCVFIEVNDTKAFVASSADVVLLAFRGTAQTRDWIRDLTLYSTKASYGTVHAGFLNGFAQVRAKVESALGQAGAKNKKLVLTGHSLGGALATIAAAELFSTYPIAAIYTFGQPAVGKSDFLEFMKRMESQFFRIVNEDDVVARVPPGYVHLGTLSRLRSGMRVDNEAVFSMANIEEETPTMSEEEFFVLQEECAATESAASVTMAQEGLFSGFGDHKLFRYMEKLLQHIP